jgi:hypothetical protein
MTSVTACGTEDPSPTSSASDPSATPTPTPTDEPTETNPVDEADGADLPRWDVDPAEGGPMGAGGMLGLVDVRTGRHDDLDRVVLELEGEGDLGYRVEYVPEPTADGSGEPVDVKGDSHLQVALYGMGMPFDNGIPAFGDHTTRVPARGADGIAEVAPGGVFEGIQQAFVGIAGPERPFRAFVLTNPTRVVIDVQHQG